MNAEENEYLVVYLGHNTALLLYQRLVKKSCKVELVSTPIKLSYGCSKSVKFNDTYMDIVRAEIQKLETKPQGIYRIIKKGKLQDYQKV